MIDHANRRYLWLGSAVILAVAAVTVLGPLAMRNIGFFRVRKVELIGVRYQVPEVVLESLALAPDQNLFTPARDVERRALAIPGVVSARVERELPGTLRIVIEERAPVALVPGPEGLVAVDGEAHPLGYDPSATGFDLPIVARADSTLLRALAAVKATDSVLFGEVSTAQLDEGRSVILELATEKVILRGVPAALDILAVDVVRRHLEADGLAVERIDARLPRKVFVKLSGA